jgi:hypothetical protein
MITSVLLQVSDLIRNKKMGDEFLLGIWPWSERLLNVRERCLAQVSQWWGRLTGNRAVGKKPEV